MADGPPELGKSSLSLLGALHGFQSWQMFEARRILESELAALAAERGREQQFAAMSEEVAEMYATVNDPIEYLIHDVRFHRVIAQASGNPILAALMETITSALYDERRKTAEHSARPQGIRRSASRDFRAIRSRSARRGARGHGAASDHGAIGPGSRNLSPTAATERPADSAGSENRDGNLASRDGTMVSTPTPSPLLPLQG